jgi:hypothetical protein
MTYNTKNQFANMLDHRAKSLAEIRERLSILVDDGSRCAVRHLDAVLEHLADAAGDLRGAVCVSAAQRAMDAHQPGLPPGGGQPDLF